MSGGRPLDKSGLPKNSKEEKEKREKSLQL